MAVAMQQLEIVKGVLTTQRPGLDMVNLDQVMERDVKSAERTLTGLLLEQLGYPRGDARIAPQPP